MGGVVDLDREGDEGGGEVLDQAHRRTSPCSSRDREEPTEGRSSSKPSE
jgi:hypothetical protein